MKEDKPKFKRGDFILCTFWLKEGETFIFKILSKTYSEDNNLDGYNTEWYIFKDNNILKKGKRKYKLQNKIVNKKHFRVISKKDMFLYLL